MSIDGISSSFSGGQAERVRRATAQSTDATQHTNGKTKQPPKLDSALLTKLGFGALEFISPGSKKEDASTKAGKVDTSKKVETTGEKRAKTAVSIGGTCVTAGLALSELGIGIPLMVAGVGIDAAAILYSFHKGYGMPVTIDAVASLVPFVGEYIKKAVEAA